MIRPLDIRRCKGVFVGCTAPQCCSVAPCCGRKKSWWQGNLPLRTHTPLSEGRKVSFSGGRKTTRPKDRTKTPTENKRSKGTQKEQKGPRLGHRGQNPNQETRKTGKPRFRVNVEGKEPQTVAETLLNLVDERAPRSCKEADTTNTPSLNGRRGTTGSSSPKREKKKKGKKESDEREKGGEGPRCVFRGSRRKSPGEGERETASGFREEATARAKRRQRERGCVFRAPQPAREEGTRSKRQGDKKEKRKKKEERRGRGK